MLRELGIGLERRQHRPAVHARHHDVERDRCWTHAARERESLLASGRDDDPNTLLREEPRHQIVDDGIVVDHQHRALDGRR